MNKFLTLIISFALIGQSIPLVEAISADKMEKRVQRYERRYERVCLDSFLDEETEAYCQKQERRLRLLNRRVQKLRQREEAAKAADPVKFLREEVHDAINDIRRKNGLLPLRTSEFLTSAAQSHSDDMLNRSYFDHLSPEGTTPKDRIESSGYLQPFYDCNCAKSYTVGENIAIGQWTVEQVVEGWMNSPEHRDNILTPEFSETGFGLTRIQNSPLGNYDGYLWVQKFGDITLD